MAVNEVLRSLGLKQRTASLKDLELILRNRPDLVLMGHYEDPVLVLRSKHDSSYKPNDHLARSLDKQLKSRNANIEYPVMIPLFGLQLQEDKDSFYGLSFILRDDAEVIHAPILSRNGSFRSEDVDRKTGLTTRLDRNGNRVIWTRPDGLSWLYLGGGLDLYSDGGGLDYSNSDGRVVVVSDAVAPKI